ncbi:uncharacterized protein BT62DRAFT_733923 [Guyanagaster necrorhizus]|uniref:Uncharacterized protein n=1 Tax=Guyanagaster necrorhizus TaxID=856835 RepID=A0A9P8AWG1_9AGAR|nr:uncharacterized protein BT62DRAFT_733923 [Guyanagaster necrorhizus MCA 3950]KAG7448912.1 hypothetical protein BT62DRAFT_733923 [Guyanagaster necrorhizus MCA 3950]
MSQSSQLPGSNLNPHTGRKAIIAMGALILGYTSFYLYLDRKDRKRVEQGRLALRGNYSSLQGEPRRVPFARHPPTYLPLCTRT